LELGELPAYMVAGYMEEMPEVTEREAEEGQLLTGAVDQVLLD
jgi:hypothetical protein